jgi:hypothetical protein
VSPERLMEFRDVINKQIEKYEKSNRKIKLIIPKKSSKTVQPDSTSSYIG